MKLTLPKTALMGVLNVTPDSFSDGGVYYQETDKAVKHALSMIQEGADIIDIGGESTRPGSVAISVEQELERVLPVITKLRAETDVPISIDTYKPEVARACLEAGATLLNDITGLTQEAMLQVATEYNCPVVIMHMQGTPKEMQKNPTYSDVVGDIKAFFQERIQAAKARNIEDIILDPGIGFGKTLEHNLQILNRLHEFTDLGFPILIGTSRKSFIGTLTKESSPSDRLSGTIASNVIALWQGASIFRVHDVEECKQALLVAEAIKNI